MALHVGWLESMLDNVAVLPAERKSLSSFRFADRTGLVEQEAVAYPSPIYDFQEMLDSAQRRMAWSSPKEGAFSNLTKVLEGQILRGNIHMEDQARSKARADGAPSDQESRPAPLSEGTLSYMSKDGVLLPMYASASIVRALAGLDVYLTVYCERDGLLVIDEPEMNAHPEAQLKIIEFVALMVHHGLRVVLTTHSPYIVDHLSNLMQASRLSENAKQIIAPKFKLGMAEAFLSPEDVSAYLFDESGAVDDILDREQGIIDLASFSRPTEYMANLINAIWKAEDEDAPQRVEQDNAV
jgi:AAA ATPase domain